jgi:quercetin dioxygenase-like cupin family protein
MKIKNIDDVPSREIEGIEGVGKQILLGPDDGSNEIVMRQFTLEPGCQTPHHNHPFPHLVEIRQGEGSVIDMDGNEMPLKPGSLVYVNDDDIHHFANTGSEPFVFVCIVPARGEK